MIPLGVSPRIFLEVLLETPPKILSGILVEFFSGIYLEGFSAVITLVGPPGKNLATVIEQFHQKFHEHLQ